MVGECHRIKLIYANETPTDNTPASIVLKIASRNPQSRASGLSLGIYEREVRFYNEVAPQLADKVNSGAKSYHGDIDRSTGAFTLLLEDAGPDAEPGDDIKGATLEQARMAMRELGKMQAALIMDSSNKEWLVREPPIFPALLRQLFTSFSTRYKAQIEPRHFQVCEKLVTGFGGLMSLLREPGTCTMAVTHGDFRLDNLLFMNGGTRLMVVDWQCIAAGPVLGDVAYFIGSSVKTEDRRLWQQELLEVYCRGLEDVAGEPVLTLDDCVRELRLNAFIGVIMAIISSIQAGRTDRGDEMFMTMLARHCELVYDLGSLGLLGEDNEDMAPLKPAVEDEKRHTPGVEKDWNESWYFDFVDREQGVAGWVRMGLVPNRDGNWYHATLTQRGKPTTIVSEFHGPEPQDNLDFCSDKVKATHDVVEPLQEFRLTLQARSHLHEQHAFFCEGEAETTLNMNLNFTTDGVPYGYRITTRYEIPCKVSGTITTGDGAVLKLRDVPGQRDHSFGVRDWWSMDWVWASFHLENGQRFHATDLRLPEVPRIGMGYMQRDGTAYEIETLSCDEVKDQAGLVASMTMTIKTIASENEVIAKITPVSHTALKLPSPDMRVALFDRAWAEIELETGEKGVGWFEWNHNPPV